MTCKDCVHYELCEDWFEQIKEEGIVTGERSQHQCESFKNKADFVEVVRCKECKHYTNTDTYRNPPRLDFHWCNKLGNVTKENDYCSYGERWCEE